MKELAAEQPRHLRGVAPVAARGGEQLRTLGGRRRHVEQQPAKLLEKLLDVAYGLGAGVQQRLGDDGHAVRQTTEGCLDPTSYVGLRRLGTQHVDQCRRELGARRRRRRRAVGAIGSRLRGGARPIEHPRWRRRQQRHERRRQIASDAVAVREVHHA